MNIPGYLRCIAFALIINFPLTLLAQTAIKMQLPTQSKEPLSVTSLINGPLPVGATIVLSDFNFGIYGGNPPYNLTWLKDNQAIATGNIVEINPVSGSSYALKVTDKKNCNATVTINNNLSAIENSIAFTYNIAIAPTLVKDHITVSFTEKSPSQAIIKIIDARGVVKQKVIISGNAIIPVNLTSGIYIVMVEQDHLSAIKKVIVH